MSRLYFSLLCAYFLSQTGCIVRADTIEDSLSLTYQTNPSLQAERRRLEQVCEGLPIARSAWAPQVSITSSADSEETQIHVSPSVRSVTTPFQGGIVLNQAIYSGGSIGAGIDNAEALVKAEIETLHGTEQMALLAAATAYADVYRDQLLLELNKSNVRVLEQQLKLVLDRYALHEQTKVDINQSQSRLASARAGLIQSEGQLTNSRASYALVIGQMPGTLSAPSLSLSVPDSKEEALRRAEEFSPAILNAKHNYDAAQFNTEQIASARLPSVNLTAQYSRYWNETTTGVPGGQYQIGFVGVNLNVPLYSGGGNSAKIRAAEKAEQQQLSQVNLSNETVRTGVIQAWQALATARSVLVFYKEQVSEAELALDGVRQQQLLGARTVLDVLNADQELLTAHSQLAATQHDADVAVYQILVDVGDFTAAKIGLPVPLYDENSYCDDVRFKLLRP